MTEKRFEYHHQNVSFDRLIHSIFDNETQKDYSEETLSDLKDFLNDIVEENQHLKTLNQRLKEGILWLLEILCKKDPESDIEFLCQIFFDCDYETAKEKYGTLLEIMSLE